MPLAITLLAALVSFASGLTGTWTGSIGERQNDGTLVERGSAYLQLKQDNDQITGLVGPSSNASHAIEEANLSGDKLKFSTHYADPESNEMVTWSFDLQIHGGSMEGVGTGQRGENTWTVEIRLSRQK